MLGNTHDSYKKKPNTRERERERERERAKKHVKDAT